ncbi:DNA polymerase III subunit chi [Paucibacter sp. Y2R2-4]|uniref:DNA polymerase III subunit chi n=1 Tax=Paucibacter sp. Y2R2-4 TaxID=2893553 RepID=UPI0021E47E06|nr:DNA polymerase III subunit chi [Paucibacter sp. Y2R2-4]MCV2348594.1 DNA polymerase III subunit chi [Paucibacter sp. Y2R2-4]
MTEVSFYTGVPDRLAYLCRLLRKAQQSGARMGVIGPPSVLQRLDAALWSFDAVEFVPHLLLSEEVVDPGLLEATPILLAPSSAALPHREVLLNLGAEIPSEFAEFKRVLEVVSTEPEQVQAGRRRYKQYESLGHIVKHHKVSN